MSVESLLTPLPLLLSAHAGADASRHRAIWAFDAQLAKVARTTRERAIGQMRLAWWNDVIDDPAGIKGQGEPVVDALRATGGMAATGLVAIIDGWEVLVVEPEIDELDSVAEIQAALSDVEGFLANLSGSKDEHTVIGAGR